MKKIISYLLVALFAITTFVPFANAAMGTKADKNGKITINNAVNGETYSIYRILDLESYDTERGAYAYQATEKWNAFLNSSAIKGVYVNIDAQGYVTWVEEANVAEFAKLAYASGIAADATAIAADGEAEFTNLDLGYYLVNSTVGVICSLDTTDNEVVINEKNATPSIEKEVVEVTASIGQEVHYTLTLTDLANTKNAKVTDTLSNGLTFNNNLVVQNGEKTLVKDTDYTLTVSGQTFTLIISDTTKLSGNVVITYSATVNENAITNVANTNTATLTYGNNQSITTEPTETFTYGFKFHKVNGAEEELTGAKFKLYASEDGNNEIKVVFVEEKDGINYYRVATALETGVEMEAGVVIVEGLAAGTYYLEETKAPEGYNKLAERVEVEVLFGSETAAYNFGNKGIVNTTGAILPSTGGIGTTLFVMIGSVLIAAFGVSLITKFRMSKEY